MYIRTAALNRFRLVKNRIVPDLESLSDHNSWRHRSSAMESEPMSVDSTALEPPSLPEDGANEPKYGGHSRFELELEVCRQRSRRCASLGEPES